MYSVIEALSFSWNSIPVFYLREGTLPCDFKNYTQRSSYYISRRGFYSETLRYPRYVITRVKKYSTSLKYHVIRRQKAPSIRYRCLEIRQHAKASIED